jgi:hypothetical protein
MRRLWAKQWFRILFALLAFLCLAALLACWQFRIWSYVDFRSYQEVREYPIGEDVWFGRIRSGEDLEPFVAQHPPHCKLQLGRFLRMSYYSKWPIGPNEIPIESMLVIAKDGKLVKPALLDALGTGCSSRWRPMTPRNSIKLGSGISEDRKNGST